MIFEFNHPNPDGYRLGFGCWNGKNLRLQIVDLRVIGIILTTTKKNAFALGIIEILSLKITVFCSHPIGACCKLSGQFRASSLKMGTFQSHVLALHTECLV
jgi:hypothetical protein